MPSDLKKTKNKQLLNLGPFKAFRTKTWFHLITSSFSLVQTLLTATRPMRWIQFSPPLVLHRTRRRWLISSGWLAGWWNSSWTGEVSGEVGGGHGSAQATSSIPNLENYFSLLQRPTVQMSPVATRWRPEGFDSDWRPAEGTQFPQEESSVKGYTILQQSDWRAAGLCLHPSAPRSEDALETEVLHFHMLLI